MKTRILFLFIFMALGLAACATSQSNLKPVFDETPPPASQAVTSPDPNEARTVSPQSYSMHSSPTQGIFSAMDTFLKINPISAPSAQRIMNESSDDGTICFYCQQHQF